jgi:hypothetical protein
MVMAADGYNKLTLLFLASSFFVVVGINFFEILSFSVCTVSGSEKDPTPYDGLIITGICHNGATASTKTSPVVLQVALFVLGYIQLLPKHFIFIMFQSGARSFARSAFRAQQRTFFAGNNTRCGSRRVARRLETTQFRAAVSTQSMTLLLNNIAASGGLHTLALDELLMSAGEDDEDVM